jgi:hypothetical protein
MIRFAALVAEGPPTEARLEACAAEVGAAEAQSARALLSGTRPRRIATADTLLAWVAEATNTPPFLLTACQNACPDKSELAALLLPPAKGTPPTLTEALARLTGPEPYLALARGLPIPARLILNRLATGTFRSKLSLPQDAPQTPGTCLALMTLINPALPEATFAIPHGNTLIPLTKLRLTLPETAEILAWVRANTTDRFGPLRQVTPTLVFEIAHQGTTPNARRKCGFDLIAPELIAWHRSLTPDRATPLSGFIQI